MRPGWRVCAKQTEAVTTTLGEGSAADAGRGDATEVDEALVTAVGKRPT
jgi:hypothetical protein